MSKSGFLAPAPFLDMHNILQRQVEESAELRTFLTEHAQISLLRAAEDNARKTLVLSAASLFEDRITKALLAYVEKVSASDACVISLVRNKAVKRQYHSFFEWDKRKLGPFLTLLGESLGVKVKEAVKASPHKENSEAFLEIGAKRNCLVHQNFADYSLDITGDEIHELCERADQFVAYLEATLDAPANG